MKKFQIIYADSPWHFRVHSQKGEGRSAIQHYPVMSLDDIMKMPVRDISADNSVCLMWVIDPMIEQGYQVMREWGFTPKTVGFYWAKLNKKWDVAFYRMLNQFKSTLLNTNKGFDHDVLNELFFTGLGYYTRANVEQCILGVRGKGLPRKDKGVRRLIIAPRGAHSAKPDEAYERIERLFGNVSRVELFARKNRKGWSAFGNQVENSIRLPWVKK